MLPRRCPRQRRDGGSAAAFAAPKSWNACRFILKRLRSQSVDARGRAICPIPSSHRRWAAFHAQAPSLRAPIATQPITWKLFMSGLDRESVGNLQVAKVLYDFVVQEVLPGTAIEAAVFWRGLDRIIHDFAPRNRALLKRRDELQAKVDAWYRARRAQPSDVGAHKAFLSEIGYLVPEGPDFKVD